jgi:hypothetical protein
MATGTWRPRTRAAAAALIAAGLGALATQASALEIQVLSSPPQLATGGDALIQITGLTRFPTVSLRGRDVRVDLRTDPNDPGKWIGVLYGLIDGNNEVTVQSGRDMATTNIVNSPINSTLFAGPQDAPFLCELDAFGFKPTNTTKLDPRNADCAVSPQVAYYYRNTKGEWKPFDANAARPGDIDKGASGQPMIIRQETGVINRAAYVISIPHDPAAGPAPSPDDRGGSAWNGKLMYSFGPGARGDGHHQGRGYGGLDLPGRYVTDTNGAMSWYIDHGYAIAAASLNAFGTTMDAVVSAETAAKVKEHFIELFGPPVFTVGNGQSGGSMQQQVIANAYPGLLDGVIPSLLFADGMTFLRPTFDCELLVNAFKTGTWTREQMNAVSGKYWGFCVSNGARYPNQRPDNCDAAVAKMVMDNPTLGPVRCTFQDDLAQVFGKDPKTGFARSPWDNVGVQYGLKALNDGVISLAQFIDLNQRIGGHDASGKIVAQRQVGDADAIKAAYATGQINLTNGGLAAIPYISIRYEFDGDPFGRGDANVNVHDRYHSDIVLARLMKYNGNADNYVQLLAAAIDPGYGPNTSTLGAPFNLAAVQAAEGMDAWLTKLKADTSNQPMAKKVAAARPASLVNACWTLGGQQAANWADPKAPRDIQKVTDWAQCNKVFEAATDPRIAAGSPMTDDVLKCQLKAIDAKDYKTAPTADQMAQLKAAFPDGVCDYTKPGVGQDAKLVTWAIYKDKGQWAGL